MIASGGKVFCALVTAWLWSLIAVAGAGSGDVHPEITVERLAIDGLQPSPTPTPSPPPPPLSPELEGVVAAPSPGAEPVQPTTHGALIAGINHTPGAPSLNAAVQDAKTIRSALTAYGFPARSTTMLLDGEATRGAVLAGIAGLAERLGPEDRAVVAFAGHTRRKDGENYLLTGDGHAISASELARAVGRIRAPTWVALPTCYAAGFDLPGIVGPNRIATFGARADEYTYETTRYGHSFMVQYMVREAMLGGRASGSVQEAFAYAERELQDRYGRFVPVMEDGIGEPFRLGPSLPWLEAFADRRDERSSPGGRPSRPRPSAEDREAEEREREKEKRETEQEERDEHHPEEDEEDDRDSGRDRHAVRVCSPFLRGNCS